MILRYFKKFLEAVIANNKLPNLVLIIKAITKHIISETMSNNKMSFKSKTEDIIEYFSKLNEIVPPPVSVSEYAIE